MNAEFHIHVDMNPVAVKGIDFYRWVLYEKTEHFTVPRSHSMAESPERAFVDAKMAYDRIIRQHTHTAI